MIDRMVVGGHVEHNARRLGAKTALQEAGGRAWSYAELNAFANRVAHALHAAGIAHGDKVGILSDAQLEWVGVYVGIVKLGAVAVPINYRLTVQEMVANLQDADARLLFGQRRFIDPVLGALPDLRAIRIDTTDGDNLARFCAGQSTSDPGVRVVGDDPNVILFTGGTTGRAKGVVLSHANLFWNSLDEIIDTHMHEGDNTLLATPLHHSAALNCWLLPHLYLGATATLLPKFTPEAMLHAIATYRVTNAFSPPSMARDVYLCALARELDLSSFRRWYIGGGILSPQDRDTIHALLPQVRIYFQYGLTETSALATVLKEEDYERAPHSIGRAFINCEVKILREDLSDAAPGEEGEIAVRGPIVMQGYYRRPEATAEVVHGEWLRTGDAGLMDEGGYVYFRDRLKDMVKTGGLNVYSQEVEHALLRHPAVREVAVIGLPSDKWGEQVTAIVVRHDGASLGAEELIEFGKRELAGYKVPKAVIFIGHEQLPISHSGKILKRQLRQRFIDGGQRP